MVSGKAAMSPTAYTSGLLVCSLPFTWGKDVVGSALDLYREFAVLRHLMELERNASVSQLEMETSWWPARTAGKGVPQQYE